MSSKKPIPGRCGKKTRDGGFCEKWPIAGAKVCRKHGGAAPQVKAKAEQNVKTAKAKKAVGTFGLPRSIEPHAALMEEVHRTAGAVSWLGEIVAGLQQTHVTHGIAKTTQMPDGTQIVEARAAVSVWVQLYQDERDRLVRVSKAAIECGVAEREIELAEQQAAILAGIVSAIVTDLGHDLGDKKVRQIVRTRLIEGGKAA